MFSENRPLFTTRGRAGEAFGAKRDLTGQAAPYSMFKFSVVSDEGMSLLGRITRWFSQSSDQNALSAGGRSTICISF